MSGFGFISLILSVILANLSKFSSLRNNIFFMQSRSFLSQSVLIRFFEKSAVATALKFYKSEIG